MSAQGVLARLKRAFFSKSTLNDFSKSWRAWQRERPTAEDLLEFYYLKDEKDPVVDVHGILAMMGVVVRRFASEKSDTPLVRMEMVSARCVITVHALPQAAERVVLVLALFILLHKTFDDRFLDGSQVWDCHDDLSEIDPELQAHAFELLMPQERMYKELRTIHAVRGSGEEFHRLVAAHYNVTFPFAKERLEQITWPFPKH